MENDLKFTMTAIIAAVKSAGKGYFTKLNFIIRYMKVMIKLECAKAAS